MKRIIAILTVIVMSITLAITSFAVEGPSNWAAEKVGEAIDLRIVPKGLQSDYTQNITRAEFAKVAVFYLAAAQNLDESDFLNIYSEKSEELTGTKFVYEAPFTDTDNSYVNNAFSLGIISGRSADIFDPDSPITRQEAAVMLLRAYDLLGTYTVQEKALSFGQTFSDADQIAEWAYEPATMMYQFDVMVGINDDTFSPNGYYTREQCMVTFLQLLKNAPSVSVLLPYEELCTRILDKPLLKFHVYDEFHCENYSVYYGGQTGTSHGSSYELWVVYRAGGGREVLHPTGLETGDGLPSLSHFRNDLVLYDLALSEDESTLTFLYDFDGTTRHYAVDLMTATLAEQ